MPARQCRVPAAQPVTTHPPRRYELSGSALSAPVGLIQARDGTREDRFARRRQPEAAGASAADADRRAPRTHRGARSPLRQAAEDAGQLFAAAVARAEGERRTAGDQQARPRKGRPGVARELAETPTRRATSTPSAATAGHVLVAAARCSRTPTTMSTLPPIKPITTRIELFRATCPCCKTRDGSAARRHAPGHAVRPRHRRRLVTYLHAARWSATSG